MPKYGKRLYNAGRIARTTRRYRKVIARAAPYRAPWSKMGNPYIRKVAFPRVMWTTLRYSDTYNITQGTAGVPAYYFFKLNSIYDPDHTGGGHQALYYDQLLNTDIYNQYCVYGCKFEAIITGSTPFIIAMHDTMDNAALTDFREVIENARSKMLCYGGSASNPVIVKKYFDIGKVAGVGKRNVLTDDVFAALVGASPARSALFGLYGMNPDLSNGGVLRVMVRMTYYVRLNLKQDTPVS